MRQDTFTCDECGRVETGKELDMKFSNRWVSFYVGKSAATCDVLVCRPCFLRALPKAAKAFFKIFPDREPVSTAEFPIGKPAAASRRRRGPRYRSGK